MKTLRLGGSRVETARRRTLPLVAALLVAAVAAASAGGASASTSKNGKAAAKQYKLSMLLVTAGFYSLPIWLMENKGFAQKYHLTLNSAQFQSGSGAASAIFAGGTGDISGGGMDLPVLLYQKYKIPVTIIGDMFQTNSFVLVSKAGSPYTTLSSLEGKVVGITGAGAWSNYLVDYQLRQAGLDPSQFKVTPLGPISVQMSALASGNASAVISQAPQYQTALDAGQIQTIENWVKGQWPALVFTARTWQVQQNPGAYAAFMDAYRAAIAKMEKNRTWAAQMATSSGLAGNASPADVQIMLNQYLGPKNKPCTGIWSCTGAFPAKMYANGRALLVGSGFYRNVAFPSYAHLTKGAPSVPGQKAPKK